MCDFPRSPSHPVVLYQWLEWHPKGAALLAGAGDGSMWMWMCMDPPCAAVVVVSASNLS
jgi:hypothetical protein